MLTKHAVRVGFVAVVLYVVCLVWRVPLQVTDPEVIKFHMLALKVALPGFQGYDVLSVILGGVLSFVYGFLAATLFHWLHKDCCVSKK